MKTIYALLIGSLFPILTILSGCKEETKPGCKDAYSNNYCYECDEQDNATCQYTGNGVFWYQYWVADSLQTLGVTSLSFYISGQLVGTSPLYHQYWMPDPWFGSEGPSCGGDSAVTFSRNWQSQSKHSFSYSIKDQNSSERFSGSVIYDAQQCVKVEIEF